MDDSQEPAGWVWAPGTQGRGRPSPEWQPELGRGRSLNQHQCSLEKLWSHLTCLVNPPGSGTPSTRTGILEGVLPRGGPSHGTARVQLSGTQAGGASGWVRGLGAAPGPKPSPH